MVLRWGSVLLVGSFLLGAHAAPCATNNRQGNHLSFSGASYLYANGSQRSGDPSGSATRDSALYYPELTVELFVYINDDFLSDDTAFSPLIGNMNISFDGNGAASGWRVACRRQSCCFQAFVGYQWQSASSGFDEPFRSKRRLSSFQEVCTPRMLQNSSWFQLAATYSSASGLAVIYVDGLEQARKLFVAVGDPDFGLAPSLQINYDYRYADKPWTADMANPQTSRSLGKLMVGASPAAFSAPANFAPGLTYFRGRLDEIRVWRKARNSSDVLNSAFEIAEYSSSASAFIRLANEANLSTLRFYFHDSLPVSQDYITGQLPNQAAGSILSLSAVGSVSVLCANAMYIDKYPTVSVVGTSSLIINASNFSSQPAYTCNPLASLADYSCGTGDTILVDPAAASLQLVISVLNYDDLVTIHLPTSIVSAQSCSGSCNNGYTSVNATLSSSTVYRVQWSRGSPRAYSLPIPTTGYPMRFLVSLQRCAACAATVDRKTTAVPDAATCQQQVSLSASVKPSTCYYYNGVWTMQTSAEFSLFPGPDLYVRFGSTLQVSQSPRIPRPGNQRCLPHPPYLSHPLRRHAARLPTPHQPAPVCTREPPLLGLQIGGRWHHHHHPAYPHPTYPHPTYPHPTYPHPTYPHNAAPLVHFCCAPVAPMLRSNPTATCPRRWASS